MICPVCQDPKALFTVTIYGRMELLVNGDGRTIESSFERNSTPAWAYCGNCEVRTPYRRLVPESSEKNHSAKCEGGPRA